MANKYVTIQNWGTDLVATSTSGATFVPLGSILADEVTLVLPASGVSIDVLCAGQIATPTKFFTIDAPSGYVIPLGRNIGEVMVRRTDNNNTPVNVRFSWRKFN